MHFSWITFLFLDMLSWMSYHWLMTISAKEIHQNICHIAPGVMWGSKKAPILAIFMHFSWITFLFLAVGKWMRYDLTKHYTFKWYSSQHFLNDPGGSCGGPKCPHLCYFLPLLNFGVNFEGLADQIFSACKSILKLWYVHYLHIKGQVSSSSRKYFDNAINL